MYFLIHQLRCDIFGEHISMLWLFLQDSLWLCGHLTKWLLVNKIQSGVVQCSTIQASAAQRRTIVKFSAVQYNAVQCSTMQFSAVAFNTMHHSKEQSTNKAQAPWPQICLLYTVFFDKHLFVKKKYKLYTQG